MKIFSIFFLLFFFNVLFANSLTSILNCESPFLKVIGSPNVDNSCFDMVQDDSGNFWISGREDNQSMLLQLNSDGEILQQLGFDFTSGDDFSRFLLIDSDGMLLTDGRDQSNAPTENYFFKIAPVTNDIIWAKKYPIPAYTRLERINEISPGGNYLISGMIETSGEGLNCFMMEIDRNSGNSVWQKQYHSGTTDVLQQLRIKDGFIYAAGVIRDGGLDKIRPFIMKTDMMGNILWTKYYLKSLNNSGRLYIEDFLFHNNRIISLLRGDLDGSSVDNSRAYLLEIDLDGELLSSHEYGFVGQNPVSGSRIDFFDNGYLISGYHGFSPNFDVYFMHLDENFDAVLAKSINLDNLAITKPVISMGEVFFVTQSAVINPGPEREILFGKIDMYNPEIPDECNYFSDLIISQTNLDNTFSETLNLIQNTANNPVDNFIISPVNLNLPIGDLCECVELELEICDNNLDDDGDGLIDCEDPDLQDSCCCLVPIPLDLGPDMSFCENENLLLDAGNDYVSYTWQDGFQNQNYAVTETGIYSVEVVDDCGVIQSDSVAVTALNSPFTTDTLMICQGDTAFIFGNPETESGDYMSIVSGQNGCDSTHRTTLQVVETLQSFEQLTICPGDSVLIFGNFETIAADYVSQPQMSEAGCDSIHTISLQIVSEMSVDFQILPTCENEDNGFVQAVVSGGVAPYQYFWENSNQTTDTLSNLAIGEYGLTVTDDFGCQLATTFIINSVADQMLDITVVDESCFGFQDGILMIEDATIGLNYSLDGVNFDTTTTFANLPPDTYTLTALANNGCLQTLDFTVENANEIILNLPPDITLCLGDSLRLLPQTNTVDNLVYQWSPPFGLSCVDCPTPFARPFSNAVYSLLITDENGCTATDSMAINVTFAERLFAPNVFSPNNDGINDYFYLQSDKGVKEILEFKIFGRWGQLIFETSNIQPNNPQMGWDGFFKNEKLNPDVFVWMAKVEFLNGTTEIFKGDILLIK